jgi:hypothetical protein
MLNVCGWASNTRETTTPNQRHLHEGKHMTAYNLQTKIKNKLVALGAPETIVVRDHAVELADGRSFSLPSLISDANLRELALLLISTVNNEGNNG